MKATIVAFLLFSPSVFAKDAEGIKKIDALMDAVLAGTVLQPKVWNDKADSTSVDINDEAKTNFPGGIAYGAIVSKVIPFKYTAIRDALKAPGGIFRFAQKVESQRELVKIKETAHSLSLRLSIKVPIVADIKTQVEVKVFEDTKGRGILEWRQLGEEGDLDYTRGDIVVEGQGESSKIFIFATHVIKDEKRVPWLGRGTAKNFAKTHYGNYIKAVEAVLAPPPSN